MNNHSANRLTDQWGIGWFQRPELSPLSITDREQVELAFSKPNWIHPSPTTFLADPFWCEHQGDRRILAEQYQGSLNKGRLVCLNPLEPDGEPVVVLDLEYHLSYPNPIWEGHQLYLLPEAHQTRQLRLWSCQHFPDKWQPSSLLLDDFPAIDPTLVEFEGNFYLWVGHQERDPRHQSFLFSSKSIHGPWKHHPNSPIRHHWTGRNGGAIIEMDGQRWRPCQNRRGTYGASLVLRQLRQLSPTQYEEGPPVDWTPGSGWPYPNGLHHIHQHHNHWVFDAKRFVRSL